MRAVGHDRSITRSEFRSFERQLRSETRRTANACTLTKPASAADQGKRRVCLDKLPIKSVQ
jgi:hypothetical protein